MRFIFAILAGFIATSSQAAEKSISCVIDKQFVKGQVAVPVAIVRGAEIVDEKVIEFQGVSVSARWQKGSTYERQQSLTMTFGDLTSTIYDFNLETQVGPLNVIESKGIRFQCGVQEN